MKNQTLIDTITTLQKANKASGKAIWKALAKDLDKSKRNRASINLSRIDRHTEEGQYVAVPGKVLAAGNLTKPVKIAAASFSEGAIAKITAAKGEYMSLVELVESGVEPSKIKIMK